MVGDVLDAWGKGISVQELLWEIRPYEGGSIIAPRASRWVHPRHYGYAQNDSRLMLSVVQSGIAMEPGEVSMVEGFVPVQEKQIPDLGGETEERASGFVIDAASARLSSGQRPTSPGSGS
jgi:hypothetical protein